MKNIPKKKETPKPKNMINWFEIPAANFERAVSFYDQIFQIKMETDKMNGYSMAFFPADQGISGAIICGEGANPSQNGALLYLNAGEDLNQVLSKVEDAGGKVILGKQKISKDGGFFALFIDSEGNKMALHSTA